MRTKLHLPKGPMKRCVGKVKKKCFVNFLYVTLAKTCNKNKLLSVVIIMIIIISNRIAVIDKKGTQTYIRDVNKKSLLKLYILLFYKYILCCVLIWDFNPSFQLLLKEHSMQLNILLFPHAYLCLDKPEFWRYADPHFLQT